MLRENNIAIYIRLSLADKETGKTKIESNSIIGQRFYINNYLDNNDYFKDFNRIEYIDDGFTGTNENRPKFQEMIRDMKKGYIKMICVKDTSRLFRDYILAGNYIECVFPILGVRFISINDNYDSNRYLGTSGNIELAVRNIVYASYSKDLSTKIKKVNEHLINQGKYKHHIPPYGYIKDPNDKYKLIIDPMASQVVRQIFNYAIDGLNTIAIAKKLNENNIATRGNYLGQLYPNYGYLVKEDSVWEYFNIHKMLINEVYIGTMIAYRRQKDSFYGKIKSREPIKIKNTHDPIVTIEEFEKAQLAINKVGRKDKIKIIEKERYPLTRKIVCGNCQCRLDKVNDNFVCKQSIKNNCSKTGQRLKISMQLLEEKVSNELHNYILSVIEYYEQTTATSNKININNRYSLKINNLEKNIQSVAKEKFALYEEYIKGVFSKETYFKKKRLLENKLVALETSIKEVENEKYIYENTEENIEEDCTVFELAKIYVNFEELTYKLVNSFIEKIHIYDNNRIEIIMKYKF